MMFPSSDLRTLAVNVQTCRTGLLDTKRAYNEAFEAWEAEHQELITQLAICREAVGKAEAELRTATVAAFEETGEKQPGPGVGIRIKKRTYYPEDDALNWAKTHGVALSLNERAFERVMLMALSPDERPEWFVISEYPEATIATDLGKALTEVVNE